MPISRSERIRRASLAAVSTLVLCATGAAGAAQADQASTPFSVGGPTALKPLRAAPDDLVFRGETARRSFSVLLSGSEPDEIKQLQVGFTNSVVLLPEQSSLKISVNGRALASVPLRGASAVETVPADIPSGILHPGLNTVEVEASMQHRVDCSLGASYELWTRLDPARTGLLTPSAAAGPTAEVEDLARQAQASDGTTRIHLRVPAPLDPATLTQAATLIGGLVSRAHLPRPVVDIGPEAGQGAGFDVLLDGAAIPASQLEGQDGGIAFARDTGTGRLAVVLMGRAGNDRDAALSELLAKPATPLDHDRDLAISGAVRVGLADLDVKQSDFAGRHGEASFELTLPADFLSGDYDKARFFLDASYAAGLEAGSTFAIRVNGIVGSTVSLSSAESGTLRQHAMDLPLRLFHAGRNEVAIDSTATRSGDRQCDVRAQDTAPRFTLSPTSEFEFPAFARLGTAPQLADALTDRSGNGTAPVPVYLSGADAETAAAALTVLANKAAAGDVVARPDVRFAMPEATDTPGLVIAAWNGLPVRLTRPLGDAIASKDAGWAPPPPEQTTASNGLIDRVQGWSQEPNVAQAWQDLRSLGQTVGGMLPTIHSTSTPKELITRLPVSAHSLLFAAAEPVRQGTATSILPLPAITTDKRQWMLVTAPSAALIQSGVARMVTENRWSALQGRAVSFDPDKRTLATLAPTRVTYLLPDHVVLSDLRPVLGGLMSDNIELSAVAIMLLIAVLGISTHALVRRPDPK